MINTDKTAILMAAYNGEKYLKEQIDSILDQSFQDWELFIHDDGSKDSTVKILESYAEKYPDRIHVLKGPAAGGAKNNFLYLMNSVSAPYILFSDQDDVWKPKKVEKTLNAMQELENLYGNDIPLLVFTELTIVDQKLNILAEKMCDYQKLNPTDQKINHIMLQNEMTGCTMMINKKLRDMGLKLKHPEKIIMHDWWLALIAVYFGKTMYIKEPQIFYRQHGDNSVGAKDITSWEYIRNFLENKDKVKESLLKTQIQAEEFVDVFQIEDEMLTQYAKINKRNKISRLSFYANCQIWKSDFIRNLGLLVFG